MTPKEGVIEAFELGIPDTVPVSLIGGGVWTITTSGNTFDDLSRDPKKLAEVIISANDMVDGDIIYVGSGFNNFHVAALGGEIKARPVGAPDLVAPPMNNVEDLNDLDPISLESDAVVNTIREATGMVNDAVGGRYLITATTWGPFTFAAQVVGIENLMTYISTDPDFVKEVLDFSRRAIMQFYQPLLDEGVVGMISLAEPSASGELISRRHFREYAIPYIRQISKDVRKKGVYSFLHICGYISDRIEDLAQSGMDCISVDSSMDLGRAKDVLGDKMCIAGNVDPIGILAKGTREDVVSASRRCIEEASSGGGFVLMPGCDIPPSTPLTNIRAFISTAKSWKLHRK
ncbi:MAG: uroporphyrinogen decarboxylase family protein [Candidatus Hydrothermarchaeales archaeon]